MANILLTDLSTGNMQAFLINPGDTLQVTMVGYMQQAWNAPPTEVRVPLAIRVALS